MLSTTQTRPIPGTRWNTMAKQLHVCPTYFEEHCADELFSRIHAKSLCTNDDPVSAISLSLHECVMPCRVKPMNNNTVIHERSDASPFIFQMNLNEKTSNMGLEMKQQSHAISKHNEMQSLNKELETKDITVEESEESMNAILILNYNEIPTVSLSSSMTEMFKDIQCCESVCNGRGLDIKTLSSMFRMSDWNEYLHNTQLLSNNTLFSKTESVCTNDEWFKIKQLCQQNNSNEQIDQYFIGFNANQKPIGLRIRRWTHSWIIVEWNECAFNDSIYEIEMKVNSKKYRTQKEWNLVFKSDENVNTNEMSMRVNRYTVQNLMSDCKYQFRIRYHCLFGMGVWSNIVSQKTNTHTMDEKSGILEHPQIFSNQEMIAHRQSLKKQKKQKHRKETKKEKQRERATKKKQKKRQKQLRRIAKAEEKKQLSVEKEIVNEVLLDVSLPNPKIEEIVINDNTTHSETDSELTFVSDVTPIIDIDIKSEKNVNSGVKSLMTEKVPRQRRRRNRKKKRKISTELKVKQNTTKNKMKKKKNKSQRPKNISKNINTFNIKSHKNSNHSNIRHNDHRRHENAHITQQTLNRTRLHPQSELRLRAHQKRMLTRDTRPTVVSQSNNSSYYYQTHNKPLMNVHQPSYPPKPAVHTHPTQLTTIYPNTHTPNSPFVPNVNQLHIKQPLLMSTETSSLNSVNTEHENNDNDTQSSSSSHGLYLDDNLLFDSTVVGDIMYDSMDGMDVVSLLEKQVQNDKERDAQLFNNASEVSNDEYDIHKWDSFFDDISANEMNVDNEQNTHPHEFSYYQYLPTHMVNECMIQTDHELKHEQQNTIWHNSHLSLDSTVAVENHPSLGIISHNLNLSDVLPILHDSNFLPSNDAFLKLSHNMQKEQLGIDK